MILQVAMIQKNINLKKKKNITNLHDSTVTIIKLSEVNITPKYKLYIYIHLAKS